MPLKISLSSFLWKHSRFIFGVTWSPNYSSGNRWNRLLPDKNIFTQIKNSQMQAKVDIDVVSFSFSNGVHNYIFSLWELQLPITFQWNPQGNDMDIYFMLARWFLEWCSWLHIWSFYHHQGLHQQKKEKRKKYQKRWKSGSAKNKKLRKQNKLNHCW